MSQLALYCPDADVEPAILPFRADQAHAKTFQLHSTLARAKTIHHNQTCPDCQSAAVDPIELNDCQFDRFGQAIPGTATVVAFHCNCCQREWTAR